MTNQVDDNILLSGQVAQWLNISSVGISYELQGQYDHVYKGPIWLHEDSARCFQLACDHNINIHQTFDGAKAYIRFRDFVVVEPWRNHPTKYIANNVAILKCLLESL
jgi:hypothetical protein